MDFFYTNAYQKGNRVFLRGYSNGKRFLDEVLYQPYLFLPGDGEYKTVHGQRLVKNTFKNIKTAREFVDMYSNVSNVQYYGTTNWVQAFLNDEFPNKINYKPELISIVSLDIEVSTKDGMPDIELAEQPVTAITIVRNGSTLSFGTKVYRGKNPYVMCNDEKIMFEVFLRHLYDDETFQPDVITGWSVDMFDIPYLINRARVLFGEEFIRQFSPLGVVKTRNIVRAKSAAVSASAEGRTDVVYEIAGVSVLDYLQLYKKFGGSQESYALNHIAKIELGRGKHDYSDVGTLDDLYELDFDRYINYNVEDAILVEEIEKKKKYLQIVFSIAYNAKINYIDAMTTSRPWDAIIHNHLLKKKVAVPQPKEPPPDIRFPGGYVKEPQLGMFDWVISFDFDALYPNCASMLNLSPETLVAQEASFFPKAWDKDNADGNKDGPECVEKVIEAIKDKTSGLVQSIYTMAPNGCVYTTGKRGFLPEIIDEYIQKRIDVKNEMMERKKVNKNDPQIEALDHFQQAIKILNNGLYGSLGQKHFRWFDIRFAESITTLAQTCTHYLEYKLNIYLNNLLKTENKDYVIACDTDSVYLHVGTLVTALGFEGKSASIIVESLDKICKLKIEPFVKRCCMEICDMFNVYEPRLKMKREAIANKAIWRGAKMYILNIYDLEGVRYESPILKTKGIEVVRSSTPMVCRENLKKCLSIIMNEDEESLQKFFKNFHTEFISLPFEAIAFPRSVNDLEKYFDPVSLCKKGTPIQVRGALVYNQLLKDKGLDKKYQVIRDKDKIRFSYLKEPNVVRSHVIAVPDELPIEFELNDYINYETQWEKSFKNPISSITDVIGWRLEKKKTLEHLL